MAIDFEKIHESFDGMMLDLCMECGGSCEKNEIATFLPGEVEYIAGKLDQDPDEFIERFCNTVRFKGENIHILKAGVCPFLSKEYRCELEEPGCKPLRCMLYPVLIGISENTVKVFVDCEGCPMAHKITDDFKNKAFAIYEKIRKDIPLWWLEFTSEYDEAVYDYPKLSRLREKQLIEPEELRDCMK